MNRLLSRVTGMLSVALALGCSDATAPTLDVAAPTLAEVLAHESLWSAKKLSNYSYNYTVTGYFILWEGRELTLRVSDGQVTGAVFTATGESLPDPADLPSVDRLFDMAEGAARSGTLRAIAFDPVLGYPTRMDLAGPPDASGSVFAVGLEAVR